MCSQKCNDDSTYSRSYEMISIRRQIEIIVILVIISTAFSESSEICSTYSGRRIYLDQNGSGSIQAVNVSASNVQNNVARIERMSNGSSTIHYHCQLELITCASCVFQINITHTNFTQTCDEGDDSCKCADFIRIMETSYEENSTGQMWCGRPPFTYRSRGRSLVINYVYQTNHNNPFNLSYVSRKNVISYNGVVSSNQTIQHDVMKSPFFPNFYPRDVIVEHLIECSSIDSECHIELSFTDFQLSLPSVMEFYDQEDQLLQRYTGEVFRPPIIRLRTNLIRILFHANGGTGIGYRADIRFLIDNVTEEISNTHCGGLVESFGGVITMMNMTNSSTKAFDCIWLIKPPSSYIHLKTNLLVRIDTFKNMANTSSVVIRDGSTSVSQLQEKYIWPMNTTAEIPYQSFVTTLSTGFYIAFKGVFMPESRFAIFYTAFSFMDCFPGPEFLCENHRCIPFFLHCDGFDHCGDGSDENERCTNSERNVAEANQYWLTHTPNYFFPKIDHYPDLKTAALVFVASAISLIMLILLLIVILYRMNHHVREQRELQSQLRTISELLDSNANNQTEENEAAQEQPPAYENPPDYEEASSIKLDLTIGKSNTLDTHKRRRSRSRSRSRSQSQQYEPNSMLIVPSDTPTPSDVLIPDLYMIDVTKLSTVNLIECERSPRNHRRHSEVNVHSRRSSQVLLIPDSPPPEYTPRHTKIRRKLQSNEQQLPHEPTDVENHMVLIINTEPQKLIDIQESPLILQNECGIESRLDQNEIDRTTQLSEPLLSRRHSMQDSSSNFFEQQFTQQISNVNNDIERSCNHYKETRLFHANAFHWLQHINFKWDKHPHVRMNRRFSMLRRTASENELLLMSQLSDSHLTDVPAIRRSVSSGLLFSF